MQCRPEFRSYSSTTEDRSAEKISDQFILPTYSKDGVRGEKGLVLDHGKGAELYDTRGRRYIDFSAGIAVSVLGHGDEEVERAVTDQMKKLVHTSNLYHTEPGLNVAKKLIEISPGFEKVFFTNSGTEANEGALKFAKLYSNMTHGVENSRNKLVAFQGSFHGRSLGALAMTYKPKIRLPFAGLVHTNVVHVPLNDIESVEAVFANQQGNQSSTEDKVLAVIVEPVQGEGGVNPATPAFMSRLRELCDHHDAVLIFDEVQIGFGRAGMQKLWGYQAYEDVIPDILTCAKPIAAGLPMGAILLSAKFMEKVRSATQGDVSAGFLGLHGTTFGGNPVCCRAAEVVLNRISKPSFLKHVEDTGDLFITRLNALVDKFPQLIEKLNRPIGDKALYAGLMCKIPVDMVIRRALEKGVMIISAGDKNDIIRLCPPLVISKELVNEGMDVLEEVFSEIQQTRDTHKVTVQSNMRAGHDSLEAFEEYTKENATLPAGFEIGTAPVPFWPRELGGEKEFQMQLNVIKLATPSTEYATMFTKNRFPGAPIRIGKEITSSQVPISSIVVNNKISNVHPRGGGFKEVEELSKHLIDQFQLDQEARVFPSSTGIIGWQLPAADMIKALPACKAALGSSPEHGLKFAKSIMTTDKYPKAKTIELKVTQTDSGAEHCIGRITGFAKGAGMIEPNLGLATMLVFILTDIDVSGLGFKKSLATHLEAAVNVPGSFNRISVDSDQSTSDTVLLISSKASSPTGSEMKYLSEDIEEQFSKGLATICTDLARNVIRNGEGVQHLMRVVIKNCWDANAAATIGKRIVNSPLLKSAIAGNDPNVGRVIAATGNALSQIQVEESELQDLVIKIGEVTVFENGAFALDGEKETLLTNYLITAEQDLAMPAGSFPTHDRSVDIILDFQRGEHDTEIIGADLTHGYVEENAGYRS